MSSATQKTRRRTWYLLPIFFNIVGGIIAYFVLRHDDPQKAQRCLIVGTAVFAVNILFGLGLIPGLSNLDELFFGNAIDASKIILHFDDDEQLKISLNDQAQFLAVHDEFIIIPLNNIIDAHDNLPKISNSDLKMPGTVIPGTIKAGTYLTENDNKEFWFTKDKNALELITIELQNHEFDRIVLQSEKSKAWIEKINKLIESSK